MDNFLRRVFFLTVAGTLCTLAAPAQQGAENRRPNIVLILADDLGFSDIGCYGGEIQTPNIDGLAHEGVRYKQFYNAARCCPTRAALMSGLYPHQAGMGWMAAADLGTPAYQGNLNNHAVTIAEVLKTAGYRTYMSGKWHLTNERKIDGMVTDNWPLQRGFDRYFGIIPGGANYFTPVIYSGNDRYRAPDNFYLTDAISDTTVQYLDEHQQAHPDDPFFMYVAYTAPHWPLHALQEDIDKYKATYLAGWDALREARFHRQREMGLFGPQAHLSPRDSAVEAWDRLTPAKQQEMAMRMAIYAAQVDRMDQGIGRIVAELRERGELDNTLIFFLSDNGACAEYISSGKRKAVDGKEDTFESYRIDWANLSSTPFKSYKHFTYEGGIATPLVVHWPDGIDRALNNTFVSQYGHLTDIMATCVAVSGATYPSAKEGYAIHPLVGKSLVPHFTGHGNARGQVFWEHEANLAVRDGKWKLVAKTPEGQPFDPANLRLYNLEEDPTELHDLSARAPKRVQRMYAGWQAWGKDIGIFPLDTREYGQRKQAYRRQINGAFDDNLGGWRIHVGAGADATVVADTTGKLSGPKSARVAIARPGTAPEAVALFWPFRAKKGERFEVAMKAVADRPSGGSLRLEQVGKNGITVIDQAIAIGTDARTTRGVSQPLPADGQYRLALYFGGAKAGTTLWVDDVELQPVHDTPQTNHVVLISIDGLRPPFYLDASWHTPNLKRLAAAGVMAEGAASVFPSVTYPSHTSLVTGAYPAQHGILYNGIKDSKIGAWYWEADSIRVPTLWDAVHAAGKTSAAIFWPASVGAPIDYNIPVRRANRDEQGDQLAITRPYVTPGSFLPGFEHAYGTLHADDLGHRDHSYDKTVGKLSAYVIKTYKPNLTAIHFLGADHTQHRHGTDAPEVRHAVEVIDSLIGTVIQALDEAGIREQTAIVITGDHGHADTKAIFSPNIYLKTNGLITDKQHWKARFETAGGSAFLFLNDPGDRQTEQEVRKILAELPDSQDTLFRIVERDELDRMGANPGAAFALAMKKGSPAAQAIKGIPYRKRTFGSAHGYHPETPGMETGFIAEGTGIRQQQKIERLEIVDVAPLIARLLGLDMEAPDGHVVPGILQNNSAKNVTTHKDAQ
ncbi:sulfatase-like hydrolase/transferase [Parapedobacter sp. 10938]|uniref:sulfatase-like hydrolase/transferase n=1 Tax=Parapedobacter flavus TaxID=3110225 RepID=UPI002DBBD79A|nr:sulfatase-like hydrolase/transferase [Parapedobacter sp. 10938]MEC3880123.1 sulfatase-like hydrolase/transferase [Parapedobacter sp. 10938]